MQPIRSYRPLPDTHPLFRLLVPFAAGIAAGDAFQAWLRPGAAVFFWGALACFAAGLVLFRLYRHTVASTLFLVFLNIGFLCAGAGLLLSSRAALPTAWSEEPLAAQGIVTAPPRQSPHSRTVDVHITGGPADGCLVRLRLLGGDTLRPGDALFFHAAIQLPRNAGNPGEFDYAGYLLHNGISGEGFCPDSHWQKAPPATARRLLSSLPFFSRLKVKALQARDALSETFFPHFEGRSLAILLSMTLGDRSRLDDATESLYARTGTSHLLALSGLNIGILFGLYRWTVLRHATRPRLRLLLSLPGVAALWVFTFITGLPLSLVRATLMFTLGQLIAFLNNQTFSLNTLASAALIMLIASPESLFDVGFQLSCLSVFAIIVLMPRLCPDSVRDWPRVPRLLYETFSVSLAAQLGTLPLVAYTFHSIPTYALAANLLAVPLSYPLLAGALLFVAVPFLRLPLAWCLQGLLSGFHALLERVAALPGGVIETFPTLPTLFLSYVLLALLVSWPGRRGHARWLLPLLTTALIATTEIYARRPGRMAGEIVCYNFRQSPAVQCFASGRESYLWTPDTALVKADLSYVARQFWKPEGIAPPHLLPAAKTAAGRPAPPEILRFAGRSVAVARARWPRGYAPRPQQVDFLLVARGTQGTLAPFLAACRPHCVVLDGSLTDFYRKRFRAEVRRAGLPLHDMALDGALVLHAVH